MARTVSNNTVKKERVSLALDAELKERIEKIAVMQKMSLNALISELIQNYIRKHMDLVKKHDETFGE